MPEGKYNYLIHGTYSMPSQGFDFEMEKVDFPGGYERVTVNLTNVTPLAALAVVSYDGNSDETGAGGISGYGVLKFANTIALAGQLRTDPEPLAIKIFTILPISRYWTSVELANGTTTGTAIFVYKFPSAISVCHYYFVLEDVKGGPAIGDLRANGIQFIMTDAKHWGSVDELLTKPVPSSTLMSQSGRQNRLTDIVSDPPALTQEEQAIGDALKIPYAK